VATKLSFRDSLSESVRYENGLSLPLKRVAINSFADKVDGRQRPGRVFADPARLQGFCIAGIQGLRIIAHIDLRQQRGAIHIQAVEQDRKVLRADVVDGDGRLVGDRIVNIDFATPLIDNWMRQLV
jgi:hypothetical protein